MDRIYNNQAQDTWRAKQELDYRHFFFHPLSVLSRQVHSPTPIPQNRPPKHVCTHPIIPDSCHDIIFPCKPQLAYQNGEIIESQISLKEYLSFYNHSPIFRDIMYKNYNQQREFSKFYLPNTKNTDSLELFKIFTGKKQSIDALQIDLMDLLHFVHVTKIKDTHLCNLIQDIPYNYQQNSSLIPATFYAIKTLRSESIHHELKHKLPLPKIGTPHPKDFQTYEQYHTQILASIEIALRYETRAAVKRYTTQDQYIQDIDETDIMCCHRQKPCQECMEYHTHIQDILREHQQEQQEIEYDHQRPKYTFPSHDKCDLACLQAIPQKFKLYHPCQRQNIYLHPWKIVKEQCKASKINKIGAHNTPLYILGDTYKHNHRKPTSIMPKAAYAIYDRLCHIGHNCNQELQEKFKLDMEGRQFVV